MVLNLMPSSNDITNMSPSGFRFLSVPHVIDQEFDVDHQDYSKIHDPQLIEAPACGFSLSPDQHLFLDDHLWHSDEELLKREPIRPT